MDVRQSKFWQTYLEKLGWKTIPLGSQNAYVRKIPFGSIIKIPRFDPPIPFSQIDKIAKEEGAFFVKIEPNRKLSDSVLQEKLKSNGFTTEKWSLQPTKSITIDLSQDKEKLLANMEKDTRYSVRKAERDGVVTEKSRDIDKFLNLHKETSKRQRFWTSEKDSKSLWDSLPEENRALLFAKKDGKILAGTFLIFHDKIAHFYEAASSIYRRDLMAPYLIVWEGIKLAKLKGCETFDFEGIVDSRITATKKWKGFTHFKRGFGGEEVTYLGSFIKFYNLIVKFIFSLNKIF
jgi:lipid II:glycine glycyltransferase (peptidoglycan interpeptide bridge formation enzyme)